MKIVILGADYAGVFSAVNLSKHEGMEVLLIDKNSYHQLLQQILASGTKRPDEIIFSIKELFQSDVSFKQAFVESIDLETKVISTHDNSKVHYDYLIIALGACSYHYGIKGALKYSLPFRSVDKAIELNEVVSTLPAGSDIVICGGATGTSLAGALSDTPGSKLKIKLVEAHDSILPGWDRRIVEMATKSLIENNVEIIAGNLISEIRQASVVLQSGMQSLFHNFY